MYVENRATKAERVKHVSKREHSECVLSDESIPYTNSVVITTCCDTQSECHSL